MLSSVGAREIPLAVLQTATDNFSEVRGIQLLCLPKDCLRNVDASSCMRVRQGNDGILSRCLSSTRQLFPVEKASVVLWDPACRVFSCHDSAVHEGQNLPSHKS